MSFKKRLALYIRLSIEDGDLKGSTTKTESNSVSNQRKLLMAYLQSHKELLEEYDIVEFCDDGYSGTNFNRPRFQDMMELVRSRQIHCIIVKDLSRFGREYLEVGAYLELILPLFGTRFISVNEGFDSNNYLGTTGGLDLALHNLINGLYSQDLSIKVRSAYKTRSRQGQYCGSTGFYGYLVDPADKHHLIVDEAVRPAIEKIFSLCIDGHTSAEIAQVLNKEGVPPPSLRKKQLGLTYNGRTLEGDPLWFPSTVRKILKEERYTGKMIGNTRQSTGIRSNNWRTLPRSEWIIVEGMHEAIVSEEIFQAAGIALQSRIKTVNKNTAGDRKNNLFVCGFCGRKLQKSNGKVTHLFCMKARGEPESECADLHENIEELKSNILSVVQHMALVLLNRHAVIASQQMEEIPQKEKRIIQIRSRMQYLKSHKLDLYEEYRTKRITKERFQQIQAKNNAEYESLQDELYDCEERIKELKKQKERANAVRDDAKQIGLLTEYKPEIIGKLVERIRVFPGGRIELDLNCKDFFFDTGNPVPVAKEA